MKKLIKITIIAIAITFASCCGCDSSAYKYRISDGHVNYYTNDYVIYDGHVSFLADKKIDSTIIGGYYKIENNSRYKPTKSGK